MRGNPLRCRLKRHLSLLVSNADRPGDVKHDVSPVAPVPISEGCGVVPREARAGVGLYIDMSVIEKAARRWH
jgi:hypothetical protein